MEGVWVSSSGFLQFVGNWTLFQHSVQFHRDIVGTHIPLHAAVICRAHERLPEDLRALAVLLVFSLSFSIPVVQLVARQDNDHSHDMTS